MTKSLKATIKDTLRMIFFFLLGGGGFLVVLYIIGGTTNLLATFIVWGVIISIFIAARIGYYKGINYREANKS